MTIAVTMPALSPTMEVGTLAKWHVQKGDEVHAGDVIAEIETDKATMDVEAVDEGIVFALLVEEGTENIPVNSVIAELRADGESEEDAARATEAARATAGKAPPAPAATPAAAAPAAPATPAAPVAPAPATPVAKEPLAAREGPRPAVAHDTSGKRILASPLARRIAAQRGIDLEGLKGSGPRGRIVRADVEAAPATPAAAAKAAPAAVALPASNVPYEEVKLSAMRRTIARRLTESKQTVPHYYLTADIVLDPLLKLRSEVNRALQKDGVKVSVNDMLVKALGLALRRVPDANVSFGGDSMRRYSRADISVAVAIPGGLITPVVRDASEKRLSAIARETKALAARARDGKLQPEEYSGGTASISNLGMYGIRQFDAVINPPEGLIIAVGAGEKRPWVQDDALSIATVMSATGSFDHRVIDGAVGAELMAAFKDLLENPLSMLA